MENFKRITQGQVKQIAVEISKRWKFENHHTWYNCIDTKTGQRSSEGGRYNFASYYFNNSVSTQYLKMIGENTLYFDWNSNGINGVQITKDREMYLLKIRYKIVHLLCGYINDSPVLKEIYN